MLLLLLLLLQYERRLLGTNRRQVWVHHRFGRCHALLVVVTQQTIEKIDRLSVREMPILGRYQLCPLLPRVSAGSPVTSGSK